MRTIARMILLTLIVVPVAYWLLGGSFAFGGGQAVAGNSSLCERVNWVLAPLALGRREWVASMEGEQSDVQVIHWMAMDDAERGALLAQCGKKRR